MDSKKQKFIIFHNAFFKYIQIVDELIKSTNIQSIIMTNDAKNISVFAYSVLNLYVHNVIPYVEDLQNLDLLSISQAITNADINDQLTLLSSNTKEFVTKYSSFIPYQITVTFNSCKVPQYQSDSEVVNEEMCCGQKMIALYEDCKLLCQACGKIKTRVHQEFTDAQLFYLDGSKSKPNYAPKRNFLSWIDRILAKEKINIPAEHLVKIKKEMRLSGYKPGDAEQLSIKDVRAFLKNTNLTTEYNPHTSYLLTILSGISPPQLSQCEITKVSKFYDKILEILNSRVFSGGNGRVSKNTVHCPYLIYRIIKELWKSDKEKLKILKYICLQHSDTVQFNDETYWKPICETLKIKYYPIQDYSQFD